eukprot:jgi/Astpho2/2351/gw1.00044.127.1_t
MPTGGGKSLCYSLPACMVRGVVLVVSPLIALMQNQVESLKSKGVAAEYLSSTKTEAERRGTLMQLQTNTPSIKLLFVTPELLATNSFTSILSKLQMRKAISLLAVDEAHCISSWGHDFRPAYRRLAAVRRILPGVPVMALTATATVKVQEDVIASLGLQDALMLVSSFNRPNIMYKVRYLTSQAADPVPAVQWPCCIIYTLRRETADEVAAALESKAMHALYAGIPCASYHAGLSSSLRAQTLQDWSSGKCPIVAATIAFGMGVDKADVRFVFHLNLPKSLEAFYQESGRAGRDGELAHSILFYSISDRDFLTWLVQKEHGRQSKKRKLGTSGEMQVVAYCTLEACRRAFVLQYFGETLSAGACNKGCDWC